MTRAASVHVGAASRRAEPDQVAEQWRFNTEDDLTRL
jgi:hypothetical protein